MKIILKYIIARLWKNFGKVTDNVYRSGQFGPIRWRLTSLFLKIDLVIALNMNDSNEDEIWEKEFLKEKGIKHKCYDWGASGNDKPGELEEVVSLIENNYRMGFSTIIHCAGGKDRTGGAIGAWMGRKTQGTRYQFVDMCRIHGVPSNGWLKTIFDAFWA